MSILSTYEGWTCPATFAGWLADLWKGVSLKMNQQFPAQRMRFRKPKICRGIRCGFLNQQPRPSFTQVKAFLENSPLRHSVGPCEAQHLPCTRLRCSYKPQRRLRPRKDRWPTSHQSSPSPKQRMKPATWRQKLQSPTGPWRRQKEKTQTKFLKQTKSGMIFSWRYTSLCGMLHSALWTTPSAQFHLHKCVKRTFYDLLSDSDASLQPNLHK